VLEIEKDLVRWKRGKWIAVIAFVFVLQVGLMIWGSQKRLAERVVYPAEPKVAFAPAAGKVNREWLELENPFLFAAASGNGFSGEAWLRKPEWEVPEPKSRIAPAFLQLAEARKIKGAEERLPEFAFARQRRATAVLPQEVSPREEPKRQSELELGGFSGRGLATPLPLPVQFHSDILNETIVEAIVGRDGLVISARILENCGLARVDQEALELAKRARFLSAKSRENVPEVGKLIFRWHTLHLSDTNNVKR
jgi:TonB family protein